MRATLQLEPGALIARSMYYQMLPNADPQARQIAVGIANTTGQSAVITGVSDVISPAIAASVSCGVSFPYTLANGATLNCTYSASLPDAADRVNTVTVTTSVVLPPAGTLPIVHTPSVYDPPESSVTYVTPAGSASSTTTPCRSKSKNTPATRSPASGVSGWSNVILASMYFMGKKDTESPR